MSKKRFNKSKGAMVLVLDPLSSRQSTLTRVAPSPSSPTLPPPPPPSPPPSSASIAVAALTSESNRDNDVEPAAAANKVYFTLQSWNPSIVEIGHSFYKVQKNAADIVNDITKRLDVSNLHLFLQGWDGFRFDHAKLPDTMATFCTQLNKEMARTGRVRSLECNDNEEENILIIFQSLQV
ncbi:MAG: hypothetical protein J3R72DRAFT_416919 [Linnemannia gamsii]|nr:MAG: hypothetical protein J3R72DRAFT_416919 [Linnemannia gamsii]